MRKGYSQNETGLTTLSKAVESVVWSRAVKLLLVKGRNLSVRLPKLKPNTFLEKPRQMVYVPLFLPSLPVSNFHHDFDVVGEKWVFN